MTATTRANGTATRRRKAHSSDLRLVVMVVGGVAAAAACGFAGFWPYAPALGWAVACAIYVAWVWLVIARMDGSATMNHASAEDPSKTSRDTLVLVASIASLASLVLLLGQAKQASPVGKDLLAALGGGSVALSWFLVHTLYTVRYAVLYYSEVREDHEPVDFNGTRQPRYLDFAYLSFTIGMTFQVSDTDIASDRIRATILRHMLISYLFGAVILASAVNLVASLAS
jgi:uncharacterized membrane protein